MKLCYISAGAFAHVGHYLDHFKAAGHDVTFIALSPSPPRSVPTYQLGFGSYSSESGKWKYPLSMLAARRLVNKLKPDVVHVHYATSGGLAGLICGFHPTVVTAHGTDLTAGARSPVWRPLLKAVFDHADCVNAVSRGLREMAVGLGADPAKVAELTPGVDTALFSPGPRRAADGVLRLFCPRRLDPECDPAAVVEAAALLAGRGLDLRLTLAGGGRLREKVETLVRARGLERRVEFLGDVANSLMPSLLRAHDLYISASWWDGTSLSLLEAMAAGLFPVVSRIPANEDWLEHGRDALLHAPGDAADLARMIERAWAQPDLRAAAAARNRARVLERGDRTANMARLEALYRRLAAAKGGDLRWP